MTDKITIYTEQINILKHTIGFDKRKIKGRIHRKYEAYRNYFTCIKNRPNYWDNLVDLVNKGLMECNNNLNTIIVGEGACFYVSKKGFQFLEELLDLKITERD